MGRLVNNSGCSRSLHAGPGGGRPHGEHHVRQHAGAGLALERGEGKSPYAPGTPAIQGPPVDAPIGPPFCDLSDLSAVYGPEKLPMVEQAASSAATIKVKMMNVGLTGSRIS